MKKKLMIAVYGLLILGVSAGGTWFLRQRDIAAQTAEQIKNSSNDPPVSDLAAHVDVTTPLPAAGDSELPVAVRPDEMSVEEIVRYGLGLKAREAAIRQREDALRRTETQHRLVLADIDGEQKEIEGLLAQARDQRIASEQLLGQAQKERMESEKTLKELEDKKKKMDTDRQKTSSSQPAGAASAGNGEVNREANLKELVSVMQGLSPEVAAGVIREFANDGNTEMAVEVLSKLEERKASGILDAMKDEKLVSELMSKFLELKRPVKL